MNFIIVLLGLSLALFTNALPGDLHFKRHNWNTLIVGGKSAVQGEVPYQLQLRYYGAHHCGASLVVVQGVQIGLTAAHCVPSHIPLEAFTVVAGELSLSQNSGLEQVRQVVRTAAHTGFDDGSYEHDIAILFLSEPFQFNENVQPIELAPPGSKPTLGEELFVSGWGKLEHEGANPDILQTVELPIVDNEDCQTAYEDLGDEIFDTFICAGYLGIGGKDACQGDSGGPAKSSSGGYLAGQIKSNQIAFINVFTGFIQ